MTKLLVLFNHTLTPAQEQDARQKLEIEEILLPPENLSRIWAQISPGEEKVSPGLQPLCHWLQQQSDPDDWILVQGEFGATCYMVQWAFHHGLRPIYSTTRREAIEEHTGENEVHLVHRFRHVRFRRYELYEE